MENPVSVKELTLAQLADEFAEVRLKWKAFQPPVNPHQQRFTDLKNELLLRHASEPAEKQIQVQGEKFTVPISPQENKSTILDAMKLFRVIRKLGVARVLEVYSINLTDARKILREIIEAKWRKQNIVFDDKTARTKAIEKHQAKYIKTERTGGREVGEPVLRQEKAA